MGHGPRCAEEHILSLLLSTNSCTASSARSDAVHAHPIDLSRCKAANVACSSWPCIPPRDPIAQLSHAHSHTNAPLCTQQAELWLGIAGTHQTKSGSSLLLIAWMVYYRKEGKIHFLIRIQFREWHYASACIGNFTKLS